MKKKQLDDAAAATKLDDLPVSDSGIGTASEISKTESAIVDANEITAINIEEAKIYDRINNKNISTIIKNTLKDSHHIFYKIDLMKI